MLSIVLNVFLQDNKCIFFKSVILSEMFLFSFSGLANSASIGFLARILYSCVYSGKLLLGRLLIFRLNLYETEQSC